VAAVTARHELVNEALAIKTRAADLHAKLLHTRDAVVAAACSKQLAALYERHEAIMERINRLEAA
jgi:uncharacterized coiled-coil DUF342 family protein